MLQSLLLFLPFFPKREGVCDHFRNKVGWAEVWNHRSLLVNACLFTRVEAGERDG